MTYAEGQLIFLGQPAVDDDRLYVVDAATGAQKYNFDFPTALGSTLAPTVTRNANNELIAYFASQRTVFAVRLGENSGTFLWLNSGDIGGLSIPTVVGNSVILAGPNQFYAFDQNTGERNHFFQGTVHGGGGATVAFDSTRMQFYVKDPHDTTLRAYSYASNSDISLEWEVQGDGARGGSVAIGADGRIYRGGIGGFQEVDPDNGNVLRSLKGLTLATNMTPAVSASAIFLDSGGTTDVYDLGTFSQIASLPRSRGDAITPYSGPGVIFDSGFVVTYGTHTGDFGFDVYWVVPEPSSLLLVVGAAFAFAVAGRRRST